MKASKYNYIIEKETFSYWFNGIEHTFFKLPLNLGRKIKGLLEKDMSSLEQLNIAFWNKLIDKGFILNDDIDELNIIRKRYDAAVESKDYMLVVLPTLDCNFKCWYCIQNHLPSQMSVETLEKVKAHIDYMIKEEQITSLQLEWFGGEPFMYFKEIVKPLCKYAKQKCKETQIPFYSSATTNGYYLKPEIHKDLADLDFKCFQITLDGSKDTHDKVKFQEGCDSSFQHVLKNINGLLNNSKDINILLRINYTQENLNSIIVQQIDELISKSNRKRITIFPKKVWQEKRDLKMYDKVEEIMSLFEKSNYEVTKLDVVLNYIPCYANRKYYNGINYNGNIVKCTASDDLFTKEPPGKLNENGSITWRKGFLENYYKKRFENPTCLKCKYLPICMGRCPQNYAGNDTFYCKLKSVNINIENAIVNYIDYMYEKEC